MQEGTPTHPSDADDTASLAAVSSAMLLRHPRAGNAFEETMQRLLQTIRLGLIGPGQRLPAERELATMLSVSRDTVREAIATLGDSGYVVSRRGRYGGTFVADELPSTAPAIDSRGEPLVRRTIPREEIEDALLLRQILEVGAARLAASRELTAAERERLWQALQTCITASRSDDRHNKYRRLDSRLHLFIAELSGSPSLVSLVADVRMRINELLDYIPLIAPNIAHSDEQHEQIVIAILTGNPEVAAQVMTEHVDGSAALLRGFLE